MGPHTVRGGPGWALFGTVFIVLWWSRPRHTGGCSGVGGPFTLAFHFHSLCPFGASEALGEEGLGHRKWFEDFQPLLFKACADLQRWSVHVFARLAWTVVVGRPCFSEHPEEGCPLRKWSDQCFRFSQAVFLGERLDFRRRFPHHLWVCLLPIGAKL